MRSRPSHSAPARGSGKSRRRRASAGNDLQQTVGNRAVVLRAVGVAVQRQDELEGDGTPLVGLKRGDGLDPGTEDARPRVALLQQKLNEKMVANIAEDGMFGPRTEEVLGEFQQSVDRAPTGVVDTETADLLMTEGTPEPVAGPAGEVPHPQLVSAAMNLNTASLNDLVAGSFMLAAGNVIQSDVASNGGRLGAASMLVESAAHIDAASPLLAGAGLALQEGDEAGINKAGVELAAVSVKYQTAAIMISAAGSAFMGGNGLTDSAVGSQLMAFSTRLTDVAEALSEAADRLQAHRDPRSHVGDPIVGLRRGDGMVFGTFNRRDRVRILQTRLNDQAGAALDVDGMFGPLTTEALQAHQVAEGLPATERVDSATAKTLLDDEARGDVTSLTQAGAALETAGMNLSLATLFLDLAGTLLSSSPPQTITGEFLVASGPAGNMLSESARQFTRIASAFSSAGSDLQQI